jgi:hypothetical protein
MRQPYTNALIDVLTYLRFLWRFNEILADKTRSGNSLLADYKPIILDTLVISIPLPSLLTDLSARPVARMEPLCFGT